jgi:hypothetical protein
MQKKTVKFTKVQIFTWPGTNDQHADVIPVDHPDSRNVTNGRCATTSKVISVLKDAEGNVVQFETQNTIYVKA